MYNYIKHFIDYSLKFKKGLEKIRFEKQRSLFGMSKYKLV